MGRLDKVHINLIRTNTVGLKRVNRESEAYKVLCDSIKDHGLLNYILVRQQGNYYEVIDGLCRYQACLDYGMEYINVDIIDLDDSEVFEGQIMRSVHKIETKPIEYSRQLARMLDNNPSMTKSELAGKLGQDEDWIEKRLSLNKITDPHIQTQINNREITLEDAYAFVKTAYTKQCICTGWELLNIPSKSCGYHK